MENKVCMSCGASNPENDVRFLVVDVNSTSTTTRVNYKTTQTTTVTTEQFSGAERYVVCNNCIRRKRRANAVSMTIVGVLGGFVACMLLFGMIDYFNKGFFNSHVPLIMTIGIIVGVAAAVANCVNALREKSDFLAMALLRKAKGGAAGKVYVPADKAAYIPKNQTMPDLNLYHQKTGLKTNVGDMLFLTVIAPGNGNQVVDDFLAQKAAGGESGNRQQATGNSQ